MTAEPADNSSMSTAHAWWEPASEEAPANGEHPGASVLDQLLQTGLRPDTPAVTAPATAPASVSAPVPAVPVPPMPAASPAPEASAPVPVPDVPADRPEVDPELAPPSNSSIATLAGLMRPSPFVPAETGAVPTVAEPAPIAAPAPIVFVPEARQAPVEPVAAPEDADEADDDLWTEIERAAAAARLSETPEAWRALAMTAEVVSAFAQTMESIAEAKLTVRRIEEAAEEARRLADRADAHATESQRVASELSRAAEEADLLARSAARTAAEAKDRAADAVEVVPALEQAAQEAEAASIRAREQHRALEEAVDRARRVNTAEAWTHALSLARGLKECGRQGADPVLPSSADED